MSAHDRQGHAVTLSPEEGYRHDLRGYQLGLLLAVVLTVIPFGMVALGLASFMTTMVVVAILGIIQLVVHVRYFLHVDLSPARRDDLHLILFSGIILAIMIFGTIWILVNLQGRMMDIPGGPMHPAEMSQSMKM